MISDYERYHGVFLRELIVKAPAPFLIETSDVQGRINSFCLGGRVGLHIKHSSKRIPPWSFTFNEENVAEIEGLLEDKSSCWLGLVCGGDGILSVNADEFKELTRSENEATPFLRVDRDRNTMYRVFGNAGRLQAAKPRGVAAIIDEVISLSSDNRVKSNRGQ